MNRQTAKWRAIQLPLIILLVVVVYLAWGAEVTPTIAKASDTANFNLMPPEMHPEYTKPVPRERTNINAEQGTDTTGNVIEIIEPVQAATPNRDKAQAFVQSYGGRISDSFFTELYRACGEEYVREVIAMSVSETAMGNATAAPLNLWGWDIHNGYSPTDEAEMATTICNGVKNYYPDIAQGVGIGVYTGNDRESNWKSIFDWSYGQMR